MTDLDMKSVLAAFAIVIVLFLGLSVVDSLTTSTTDGTLGDTSTAVLLNEPGEFVSIANSRGIDETVYNSRGKAVNLTGADDSFVETNGKVRVATDGNWTVSTWAFVDSDSASDTQTAVSINGRLIINYNGTANNWTAWYYDEGSRNSYQVNVSATDQPSTFSNIVVVRNNTNLTIYRNTTVGESVNLTNESIIDAPVNSTQWDGRLDEVRTFDTAFNSAKRNELHANPVGPLKGTERTGRIMFDQANKSNQLFFFASVVVTTSNVTYSDGLPGKILEEKSPANDTAGESDYVWREDGPEIKPLAGGEVDGAPVVYVDYTGKVIDSVSRVISAFSAFSQIASLLPILIVGIIIVILVNREA